MSRSRPPSEPRISAGLIRLATLTVGAMLIVAAVSAGWREGGFWIAVVGLGLGGAREPLAAVPHETLSRC